MFERPRIGDGDLSGAPASHPSGWRAAAGASPIGSHSPWVGVKSRISHVLNSLTCALLMSAVAFVGVWFGDCFVKTNKPWSFIDSLARVDGQNYKEIIESGYSYQDKHPSS